MANVLPFFPARMDVGADQQDSRTEIPESQGGEYYFRVVLESPCPKGASGANMKDRAMYVEV